FHQTTSREGLLAEQRRTVLITNALRLLGDIEELLVGHDAGNAVVRLVMAVDGGRLPALLEATAQHIAKLRPAAMVRFADAGSANVLGAHRRVEIHRRIASAEEAGIARRHAAAFGGEVERDVIGDLARLLAELA